MAKTNKRPYADETERDEEAPAHKTRRSTKQMLKNIVLEPYDDDDDEEVDTFERIRPKHQKKR